MVKQMIFSKVKKDEPEAPGDAPEQAKPEPCVANDAGFERFLEKRMDRAEYSMRKQKGYPY